MIRILKLIAEGIAAGIIVFVVTTVLLAWLTGPVYYIGCSFWKNALGYKETYNSCQFWSS